MHAARGNGSFQSDRAQRAHQAQVTGLFNFGGTGCCVFKKRTWYYDPSGSSLASLLPTLQGRVPATPSQIMPRQVEENFFPAALGWVAAAPVNHALWA